MACGAIKAVKGTDCSRPRTIDEWNPTTLSTAIGISTAAPNSGVPMVPGAPSQTTPMNQSVIAAPIDIRCVSDEPNKATNVAITTVALAVIPTVERRSKVIFSFLVSCFCYRKSCECLLHRTNRNSQILSPMACHPTGVVDRGSRCRRYRVFLYLLVGYGIEPR